MVTDRDSDNTLDLMAICRKVGVPPPARRQPSASEMAANGGHCDFAVAGRPSALGKHSWLFVGHPEAGERSAVIYTLLGSCRRQGINPCDYLKDLFTLLPSAKIAQIKEFAPAAWAKAKEKLPALVA